MTEPTVYDYGRTYNLRNMGVRPAQVPLKPSGFLIFLLKIF